MLPEADAWHSRPCTRQKFSGSLIESKDARYGRSMSFTRCAFGSGDVFPRTTCAPASILTSRTHVPEIFNDEYYDLLVTSALYPHVTSESTNICPRSFLRSTFSFQFAHILAPSSRGASSRNCFATDRMFNLEHIKHTTTTDRDEDCI